MAVPLHTLIKLTPRAYGTIEDRLDAKIPAVSTWRGKGSVAKHEDPIESAEMLGGGLKAEDGEIAVEGVKGH